jgi:hypothetical protein
MESSWDDVEPETWNYSPNNPEYTTEYSETLNCVFITRAPFFTLAAFCSPCAPGAGDLDSPRADGVPAYCFGHDWFDGGVAPYDVFRVADGARVEPEREPARSYIYGTVE